MERVLETRDTPGENAFGVCSWGTYLLPEVLGGLGQSLSDAHVSRMETQNICTRQGEVDGAWESQQSYLNSDKSSRLRAQLPMGH